MESIKVQAIKVSQPIGDFYIGVMDAKDLVSISYSDVRKMTRDVEDYLGIQRQLKKKRVEEIKDYISSLDSTFPNSIIVSIKGKYVAFEDGEMTIQFEDFEREKVAKVLDGQHRLAGFTDGNYTFNDIKNREKPFQLVVTFFVDRDISIQAKVFAMVNQNQTKVNPSLVYDLESLSKSRSPDKTAHQIAVLLNKNTESPFYQRIKRLGIKTVNPDGTVLENELLTQAAFVSNLVKLISPKPKEDRNILLGKDKGFFGFKSKSLSYLEKKDLKRCVFRKSFVEDKDENIALNVSNYFEAVSKLWKEEWDKDNKESVLNKTVGFIALVRLLRNIINLVTEILDKDYNYVISSQQYFKILKSTEVSGEFFYSVDAVSKSSGQIYKNLNSNLFKRLRNDHGFDEKAIRELLESNQ
ncbi:DGQHR domain-containing protein [Vibrio crassostreae]|uniref:DGQHR domain-containing protein n=1 Tax=Vibrio crassostreae TaxID=246167 RepID=UPI00202255BD|nr:DGQHR domain-containing protein [Vibrio crassostreae]